MKHVRTFEKFRNKKNRDEIIRESVLQVNDIYKVKTMIDIPQSLINSYVKKVKETTGKNLRQFFGDVDIAEELVKWINVNGTDIDKIPGGALMGGQSQGQSQAQVQVEGQPQAQLEPQAQTQPQAQPQVQIEGQPQVQVQAQGDQSQAQDADFEDPQAQPQGQAQGQNQVQGQVQDEFSQGQSQDEDEDDEDELPI